MDIGWLRDKFKPFIQFVTLCIYSRSDRDLNKAKGTQSRSISDGLKSKCRSHCQCCFETATTNLFFKGTRSRAFYTHTLQPLSVLSIIYLMCMREHKLPDKLAIIEPHSSWILSPCDVWLAELTGPLLKSHTETTLELRYCSMDATRQTE